ncbi:MAG: 50S ribosomal protein L15 [Candidatus Portnoybacteria bacterium]
MQLHQLKIKHSKKDRKRIGRGGKKGTYSGKGIKGQKSRAGKKPRPGFSGGDTSIIKRLPKQRGSVGKVPIRRGTKLAQSRIKPAIFNLEKIEKSFKKGEIVSPKNLLKKGLISKMKGRIPKVKILGKGELKEKLVFRGVSVSKAAKKKITEKQV